MATEVECPGKIPEAYLNNPGAYVGVSPEGMHCRHWQEDGDDCCRCGAVGEAEDA